MSTMVSETFMSHGPGARQPLDTWVLTRPGEPPLEARIHAVFREDCSVEFHAVVKWRGALQEFQHRDVDGLRATLREWYGRARPLPPADAVSLQAEQFLVRLGWDLTDNGCAHRLAWSEITYRVLASGDTLVREAGSAHWRKLDPATPLLDADAAASLRRQLSLTAAPGSTWVFRAPRTPEVKRLLKTARNDSVGAALDVERRLLDALQAILTATDDAQDAP